MIPSLKMTYCNQCRICLADGAIYSIFEDIEYKDSIYSKLYQCFNENIQNVEGYPEKICDSCCTTLDTVYRFVTKYRTTCKLLESGLIVVKKEIHDKEVKQEEFDIELFKTEPLSDFDWLESNDEVWEPEPEPKRKRNNKRLSQIKAKLKSLKEINFRKKSSRRKDGSNEVEILDQESLKSNKTKKEIIKPEKKSNNTQKNQTSSLCDTCGMVFVKKSALFAHRRNHIKTDTKCLICNRVFRSDRSMKRHMASYHAEKTCFCETCGKGFAYKGTLKAHIQNIHVGRKKHFCGKCDKVFLYAKGLLIHERAEHLKIRPVVCQECGANFRHEDYLKEHMRLHTGETPFKCPVCNKGFAQRGNMKSHIKHNHRLADITPEVKNKLKPAWLKYFKTF